MNRFSVVCFMDTRLENVWKTSKNVMFIDISGRVYINSM